MAMTNEQKYGAANLAARFMALQSQVYLYAWKDNSLVKDVFNKWEEEFFKLGIDFNDLSEVDAKILGLVEMGFGQDTYYLLPLQYFNVLPKGTKLHSILGDDLEVGKDRISNDNRGGYLAYGVKIK